MLCVRYMELTWHGYFLYAAPEVEEHVGNSPGNYMISIKLKSGKYGSIYVGQSTDLQGRLLHHLSNSETNTCLKKQKKYHYEFQFCYVSDQKDRDDVQYTLYKKYPHECNDKIPTGSIISITPPYR